MLPTKTLANITKDQHPRLTLELIDRLGLYHAIFTDPTKEAIAQPDIKNWHIAYECLDYLIQARTPGSIADKLVHTKETTDIAWHLVALSPWMQVEEVPDPSRKANAPPLVTEVAREGYRAPNRLTGVVTAARRHLSEIMELKQAVLEGAPFVNERDRFGMAIRKWEGQGGAWRLQVRSALLVETMEVLPSWEVSDSNADASSRDSFLRGWQSFLDHLTELDLWDAPALKPLLDGRALASALGLKPGKWTGAALNVCTAWQLRNPGETDSAGAVEEVRKQAAELEIPSK